MIADERKTEGEVKLANQKMKPKRVGYLYQRPERALIIKARKLNPINPVRIRNSSVQRQTVELRWMTEKESKLIFSDCCKRVVPPHHTSTLAYGTQQSMPSD